MGVRVEREENRWEVGHRLKFLTPREIAFIDELLDSVGEFGKVQLSMKNGKLRFAERIESIDALKYVKGIRYQVAAINRVLFLIR